MVVDEQGGCFQEYDSGCDVCYCNWLDLQHVTTTPLSGNANSKIYQ